MTETNKRRKHTAPTGSTGQDDDSEIGEIDRY